MPMASGESGIPMGMRENASVEARCMLLEGIIEERDRFYTMMFLKHEDAVKAALAAAREAVNKSEVAYDKRFENANEFRETLTAQSRDMSRRTEVENMVASLSLRISENKDAIAALRAVVGATAGRDTGVVAAWRFLGGIVALLVGLAGLFAVFGNKGG